jgi:site-specific DNA-methyltransferase (adenine-specific)
MAWQLIPKKIMKNKILCGDSLEVLKDFEDNYFDSVVTDPPYGLAFMGKKWDYDVPQVELWKEVYRVLKPGGHILSFAGSRTYHRMAVNIEDAGFEIRDMLGWLYGSGFPKSHNIGKAIDKLQGNERETLTEIQKENLFEKEKEIISEKKTKDFSHHKGSMMSKETTDKFDTKTKNITKTKGNSQWEGWGTALKPAHEPIVMARKPFNTSVAENVLTHGTGGINIDECRVGTDEKIKFERKKESTTASGWKDVNRNPYEQHNQGRFPANIIHDGSEEVLEVFEESSRFFYCAKASKAERNMGLDDFPDKNDVTYAQDEWTKKNMNFRKNPIKNYHPTVKPIKLMEYLIRLVTPKEGIVLEPFAGSGTTLIACKQQGFNYIGIEREQEYCDIAEARLKGVQIQGTLF